MMAKARIVRPSARPTFPGPKPARASFHPNQAPKTSTSQEMPTRASPGLSPRLVALSRLAYRIVSPLGAGGMGEVYRARDPRLERDVAIKVLPEHFLEDGVRGARQRDEAELQETSAEPPRRRCTPTWARLIAKVGLSAPPQDKPPPVREILRVAEYGESWGVPADWE